MDADIKELMQKVAKQEVEILQLKEDNKSIKEDIKELLRMGRKFSEGYLEDLNGIRNTISGKMAYINGFRAGLIAVIFFVLYLVKEASGIGHFIRKLFDN